ncbi:zinc ribbon domain-containing protein [Austwickia chelonae]|uniref:zinc ribbon domain-containing protein n=1 Tax=Austwickia chelonae TaxID=100225 RepID=UPI000E23D2BF|nr:C4-type zinc ribbon domain-containing protein [Austwickia chelonae]
MKADHTHQMRLLDLQALDTRLAQIAHRRARLPEQQVLAAASAEKASADSDLVRARMQQSDVRRDVTKAEEDVQLVRDRAARNQARLDSGNGSPKELQSLQHELDSLSRRQNVLEEEQLEIMERAEAVDLMVASLEAESARFEHSVREATRVRDAALSVLSVEADELEQKRSAIVPTVDPALIKLYEKVRAQTGMGAAAVVHRRCEGCRLELLGADIERVASAAADDVIRCEECGRIMVRTADSGL